MAIVICVETCRILLPFRLIQLWNPIPSFCFRYSLLCIISFLPV